MLVKKKWFQEIIISYLSPTILYPGNPRQVGRRLKVFTQHLPGI
jgi:hypothetical protein